METFQYLILAVLVLTVPVCRSEMSGSGSGDDVEENPCTDDKCNGGTCMNKDGEAVCDCPNGTKVYYEDSYSCDKCEIGTWGKDCGNMCKDNCGGEGHFSGCDAETGTCTCNDCWMGVSCEMATLGEDAYACVLKYLESVDKDLNEFGGDVPMTDESKYDELALNLVDSSGTIVQADSASLTVVNREIVDARPLLRFSFILDEGPGNTDYDNAVKNIKDKVKTGDIRGTLIIDESDGDSGTVTLNA